MNLSEMWIYLLRLAVSFAFIGMGWKLLLASSNRLPGGRVKRRPNPVRRLPRVAQIGIVVAGLSMLVAAIVIWFRWSIGLALGLWPLALVPFLVATGKIEVIVHRSEGTS